MDPESYPKKAGVEQGLIQSARGNGLIRVELENLKYFFRKNVGQQKIWQKFLVKTFWSPLIDFSNGVKKAES